MKQISIVMVLLFLWACSSAPNNDDPGRRKAGSGWKMTVFATNLKDVDNLFLSPENVMYATLETAARKGQLIAIQNGKLSVLLDSLDRPDGLAGKDGKLFVTEEVNEGRILEYSIVTRKMRIIASGILKPEGIDVYSDGSLIVAEDSYKGRLLQIGMNGKIRVLLTKLPRPEGLCISSTGVINIALTATGKIIQLRDPVDGETRTLLQGLHNPDQVECARDGSIWITEDRNPGRLLRYYKRKLTVIRDDLNLPQGITFGYDGSVYVAEQGRSRILRFTYHKGKEENN